MSCGIAPRLSSRTCRPVQSSSCRYSANDIGRQPLFDARAVGAGLSADASDSSNGLNWQAAVGPLVALNLLSLPAGGDRRWRAFARGFRIQLASVDRLPRMCKTE